MTDIKDIVKDLENPTAAELKEVERLIRKEVRDNHKFYADILADKVIDPESILSARPRKLTRKERRRLKK